MATQEPALSLADVAARPNGGAMEARLRNVGATYDEINDVAADLGRLFKKLDEQEAALREGDRNGGLATQLVGGIPDWVEQARRLWREAESVARSERAHQQA